MFIHFKEMKTTKEVRAIVVADEGDEIIIGLQTFINWGIIPECFPLPMALSDRVGTSRDVAPCFVRAMVASLFESLTPKVDGGTKGEESGQEDVVESGQEICYDRVASLFESLPPIVDGGREGEESGQEVQFRVHRILRLGGDFSRWGAARGLLR